MILAPWRKTRWLPLTQVSSIALGWALRRSISTGRALGFLVMKPCYHLFSIVQMYLFWQRAWLNSSWPFWAHPLAHKDSNNANTVPKATSFWWSQIPAHLSYLPHSPFKASVISVNPSWVGSHWTLFPIAILYCWSKLVLTTLTSALFHLYLTPPAILPLECWISRFHQFIPEGRWLWEYELLKSFQGSLLPEMWCWAQLSGFHGNFSWNDGGKSSGWSNLHI